MTRASSAIDLEAFTAERASQFIKLDHLGELIAINIYSAQVQVCQRTAPALVGVLTEFLNHERRHHQLFEDVLQARGIAPCRGLTLLGYAGFLLGFATALFGKDGVMACTAAVETVVLRHLNHQLEYFRSVNDFAAIAAVESILAEEIAHRDTGTSTARSTWYKVLYSIVAPATACVIALGTYL
jgi:3-demethoxyubiquinol 3-hydroxylase